MNETQTTRTGAHTERARDHLTRIDRPAVNRYRPTTPSDDAHENILRVLHTDAAIASGHALLAIHEALTGLCDELARGRAETARQREAARLQADRVAGAMERAATVHQGLSRLHRRAAETDQELADVRALVERLAAATTTLAEHVSELATAATRERPRRRWWARSAPQG
ncbi:hypothetical protein [Nonomuraea longicatena]|uniref:hypothetical protein n=1 Tax=Nonomuraea longicatena TaxID=83682 RepID=UPI0031E41BC6